jgi:3-hydroxybutyryl-CoA dehydrogenase
MKLSDIKKIGTAGGGTMGFGISINFALAGFPVTILDLSDEILVNTRRRIDLGFKIMVDEGMVTRAKAAAAAKRIKLTTDINKLADADFITEAITERLADKQVIFNQLDKICKPETIIMSNTSGLLVSEIAKGVKRQDKVGLTHYFDPPHFVPGLEVAKGPGTSDETFNLTFDLMVKIRKVPVRVLKEKAGYLLNSIQNAMTAEAERLWAEGFASAEDVEKGIKATFGFRSPHEGPMMHSDLAGIWKWPKDVLAIRATRTLGYINVQGEAREKLRDMLASGKTWFVAPEEMTDAIETRDREYARRLKDLYWGKME